jgi:hypothetical protein
VAFLHYPFCSIINKFFNNAQYVYYYFNINYSGVFKDSSITKINQNAVCQNINDIRPERYTIMYDVTNGKPGVLKTRLFWYAANIFTEV